ncbi:MAG: hypothetical protein E7459_05600 [Ruminococcaceae bacterium]|nr:hypothetical protein [Oscillospiraceae bacterium]
MQNWTTPQLEELDVRLTAKDPGVVEMEATVVDGVPLPATWNVFEGVTPGVNPDMKDIPKS